MGEPRQGAWRPGRLAAAVAVGLAFALTWILWRLPAGTELRITPVAGGPPLLVLPLKPGERFTIRYYHSVENAPIWEEHSVDGEGRIYIEEERYLKFGAGMGKMPGVGRMVRRGPYEVIEDMHMPTGDFVLRVGSPGVDHTVLWRGTQTNLSAMAPHAAVQFSARPTGFLYTVWRRIHPHPATPGFGVDHD
ncbi:MAG: DUF1850 domain-containing protein [Desulfobacteraceae bacterium]|nr:DUF1850 domain-containing protein [Desulfobacteraceae bacterium]